MINILWSIINVQNMQKQFFTGYLEAKGYPAVGDESVQCSGDDAMFHKHKESKDSHGCDWVASFPEMRCLVKGCSDEGTDCAGEKMVACDGCRSTCAGQGACGGGDKKKGGGDRK